MMHYTMCHLFPSIMSVGVYKSFDISTDRKVLFYLESIKIKANFASLEYRNSLQHFNTDNNYKT